MIPIQFSSKQAYQDYLVCKGRIRVGDKVQLYLYNGSLYPDDTEPTVSLPIMVIGFARNDAPRRPTGVPIIGAPGRVYMEMYQSYAAIFDRNKPILNIDHYKYLFMLLDTDAHIAKIIKKRR